MVSGQGQWPLPTVGWPLGAGRETAARFSYRMALGEGAGPKPGRVCLGRGDASRDRASSLPSPSHSTSRNRPDATQPGLPRAESGGIWARSSGRCHPHPSHSRPQFPFCTTRTVLPREAGVSTKAVPGPQALPSVTPIKSGPVQGSCGQRAPSNQEEGWSAAHLGPPGKGPGPRAGRAATPQPRRKAQASSFVVCFEGRTQQSHKTGNSAPHC